LHFSYDIQFQKHILAAFLFDLRWAKENLDILESDYFGNDLLQGVAKCIKNFLREQAELPSKEALFEEIKEVIAPGRKYSEYEESIEEIYELIGDNAVYYQRKATEFSRVQELSVALAQATIQIQRGDTEEVQKILKEAQKSFNGYDSNILYDYWGNLKSRALAYLHGKDRSNRIPTGFYLLDDRFGGGLGQGETGIIIAPAKHGKTAALISFAANSLSQGKKILYVTLELIEEVILRRFDTNLFGFRTEPFKNNKEKTKEFYRAMQELDRKLKSKLTVVEYPTKALSLFKLQNIVEKVQPDIVFVDYAKLLKTTYHRKEERFEVSDTHEGLRRIAGECKVPIWTAHLANRPALWEKGDLGLEYISEDINVGAIADVCISINQNKSERREGTLRLHIAGNRLGATGDTITLAVDWNLSKISELKVESVG